MAVQLTQNALPQMFAREGDDSGQPSFMPIVQALDVRGGAGDAASRTKFLISDGQLFLSGALAAQCMDQTPALASNNIVKLTQYLVQRPENKRPFIIVFQYEILALSPERIGNPVDCKDMDLTGQASVAAPASGYGAPAAASYGQNMASNGQGVAPQTMYGQPQAAPGLYGGAPTGGAYGQPPATSAYNAPPAGGAYGQPPAVPPVAPQGAYGQHPAAPQGAYGQPPAGAYGQPPQPAYGGAPAYGAPPATPPQQAYGGTVNPAPAQYDGQGAIARNTVAPMFNDIAKLTPYISRWTIKGRCSMKSELRQFRSKAGRNGCVFNFDMIDQTGEIRVVAFSENAERVFPMVEPGKMYQLSKASLKLMDSGKRKWNQTGHDCEAYIENNTLLEEVEEGGASAAIPRIKLNLVPIATIGDTEPGAFVDIKGVIEACADIASINRKDGSEAKKRTMTLRDESNTSIEVTLWGDKAADPGQSIFERVREGQYPIAVFKAAKVGDFNGRTLSTSGGSVFMVDPTDIDGVAELRAWYDQGGAAQAAKTLTNASGGGGADRRATIGMIKEQFMGSGGQNVWIKLPATVFSIRDEPICYPACMNDYNGRKCQKKMEDVGNGVFTCARCQVESEPKWRYLLDMSIQDFEGQLMHFSAFGEAGEAVMDGLTADQAQALKAQSDAALNQPLQKCLHVTKMFKIKCSEDTYQEETRIKYTMQSCEPMNYAADCQILTAMMDDIVSGREIAAMKPKQPRGAVAAPAGGAPGGMPAYPSPVAQGGGVPGYGAPTFGTQQQFQPGMPQAHGGFQAPPQQGYNAAPGGYAASGAPAGHGAGGHAFLNM